MKIINKSELRIEYKQKRKDMPMDDVASKSKNAQNILLKSDIYKNAKTIMIYIACIYYSNIVSACCKFP